MHLVEIIHGNVLHCNVRPLKNSLVLSSTLTLWLSDVQFSPLPPQFLLSSRAWPRICKAGSSPRQQKLGWPSWDQYREKTSQKVDAPPVKHWHRVPSQMKLCSNGGQPERAPKVSPSSHLQETAEECSTWSVFLGCHLPTAVGQYHQSASEMSESMANYKSC